MSHYCATGAAGRTTGDSGAAANLARQYRAVGLPGSRGRPQLGQAGPAGGRPPSPLHPAGPHSAGVSSLATGKGS